MSKLARISQSRLGSCVKGGSRTIVMSLMLVSRHTSTTTTSGPSLLDGRSYNIDSGDDTIRKDDDSKNSNSLKETRDVMKRDVMKRGYQLKVDMARLDDLLTLARENFGSRRYDDCLSTNQTIINLCEEYSINELGENWLKYSAASINSAFVHKLLCNWEESERLAKKGLQLLERHFSKHKQKTAEAYELLAEVIILKGENFEGANAAVDRALEIKRSYLPEFDINFATPLNICGRVAEKIGNFDLAKKKYLMAFKNAYLQGPSPPPAACAALSNYASVLQEEKQYETALGVYRKVIEYQTIWFEELGKIQRTNQKNDHENKAKSEAKNETNKRDESEAFSNANSSEEIGDNIVIGQAQAEMGVAAIGAGMKNLANISLQKALATHCNVLGFQHPGTNNIISLLMQVNQMEETKTDPDQKEELIEKGEEFVVQLVKNQQEENKNRRVKLKEDNEGGMIPGISGDIRIFDYAGHTGHYGARGNSVRYRAENYFLPEEALDPNTRTDG